MTAKYLNLDTSVQYIKGIGPKRAELLADIGIESAEDLITYFPRKYLDRSNMVTINSLKKDEQVTVIGKVLSREKVLGRKKRYILMVGDGTGILQCVWFQGVHYIQNVFEVGETVAFSGKVSHYRGPQLIHPEYDKISREGETDPLHTGCIVPLYPSTEKLRRKGFDSRGFRRVIQRAIRQLKGQIVETLSQDLIDRQRLLSYDTALQNIHFPDNWGILKKARTRLKFEELFYIQLYLALQRKKTKISDKGIEFTKVGELTSQLVEILPFELTGAQKKVMRQIRRDMKAAEPMSRLLQGDVGAGKTIVALIAMLIAVENGYQAALMAPTEILAEQHYITIHSWLEELGVRVELFKGSQKGSYKQKALEALSRGEIDIAVGTHALVQKGVEFKKLGFVVIDEQHRFGVIQRAVLGKKGDNPDVLVMTATPIPRTLALTLYGDLDISVLDEMPAGRLPIRTIWRREDKKPAIYEYIGDEVKKGRQVYVVYPLVEESEKLDLQAATNGYHELSETIFPEFKVGLLHGRMKGEEKEKVMQDFKTGDIQILVSTTVIEVGIDVKNATVMLIEHAERFGLTQLHQLRGRVGRGQKKSMCILLTYGYLSDTALKRIKVMERTNDGFKIAEEDLEIRGPGELFGTRQHGALNLKIANLITDQELLEKARKEAFSLVESDHQLSRDEHEVIRHTYQKRYKGKYDLIRVG